MPSDEPRVRKRRSHSSRLSFPRRLYDWTAVLLLLISPFAGAVFFGANRIWTIAPFMICTFVAWIMVLLRPFWDEESRFVRLPPGFLWLAAFSVYGFLHIWISDISYEARSDWIMAGSFIAAYWSWTELTPRLKRSRFLLGAILTFASGLAWYALIQHAQGSTLSLWVDTAQFYETRATGTYICPNHFAQYLAMAATLALAVVLLPGCGPVIRLLAGYSFLVCLPAIFFTLSRSGLIGLAAGCSVVVLLILWVRFRILFWISLVTGPALLFLAGFMIYQSSPEFRSRIQGAMPGHMDPSAAGRLTAWTDTLAMIQDEPVLGHGAGSFRWAYLAYKSPTFQLWLRYTHNEYLQTLADYGAVGFLILAVALGLVLLQLRSVFLRPPDPRVEVLTIGAIGVLAAALAHAVFDFTFHIYANTHLIAMIGGLVFASHYSLSAASPRPWDGWPMRVACLGCTALALVWIAASLQLYAGYARVEKGNAAQTEFEFEKALALYRSAEAIDPTYWKAWEGIGDVHRTQAYWNLNKEDAEAHMELALAAYDKAYAINPQDLSSVYAKGDLLMRRGYHDRALVFLKQAVEENSKTALYWQRLGQLYVKLDEPDKAREHYQEALKLEYDNAVARNGLKELGPR